MQVQADRNSFSLWLPYRFCYINVWAFIILHG